MKKRYVFILLLLGIIGRDYSFASEREDIVAGGDISAPNVDNYDGKSDIGPWKLRDKDIYEQKKIPEGAKLYPYHMWILYDADREDNLQSIFLTDKRKKVVFYTHVQDPKNYTFEYIPGMEGQGLLTSPYIDSKTDEIKGDKFDASSGVKFWKFKPESALTSFPVIFKHHAE